MLHFLGHPVFDHFISSATHRHARTHARAHTHNNYLINVTCLTLEGKLQLETQGEWLKLNFTAI